MFGQEDSDSAASHAHRRSKTIRFGSLEGESLWKLSEHSCILEAAEHDKSIYIALRWMEEGLRKRSHDLKSETLPQTHRTLVAADDKIKLHRAKSTRTGMSK